MLDLDTMATLRCCMADVACDTTLRLVRLDAEGPTWCAGADLRAVAAAPAGLAGVLASYAELLADLSECPIPVIAVVDGHVRGGGVGLLCTADLVVMGPRASVTLPEVRVGLWPMMVGALLGRVMSPRTAMALALTAERLDAAGCLRVALATHVGDEPRAIADELTATLLQGAPSAVRAGRGAWRAHAGLEALPLRERLHALARELAALAEGAEAEEGLRSFFEKRPPAW